MALPSWRQFCCRRSQWCLALRDGVYGFSICRECEFSRKQFYVYGAVRIRNIAFIITILLCWQFPKKDLQKGIHHCVTHTLYPDGGLVYPTWCESRYSLSIAIIACRRRNELRITYTAFLLLYCLKEYIPSVYFRYCYFFSILLLFLKLLVRSMVVYRGHLFTVLFLSI